MRRFPYSVIDLPVPERDCFVMLAVLHCGREPKLWRQRSRD
jgi:toxin ParE1/3/4